MGLLSACPAPPRGALEAFKCAGQPKAAPEMRRLAFGVFAGSTPVKADAVAGLGATRHQVRRPKPHGPGALSARHSGPMAAPALLVVTPAGSCRGAGVCPTSGG